MIEDIKELKLPSYATLCDAKCALQDMAENTISSQIKIDGGIVPDFSYDWELEFMGAKYIMPLRQPQASKENTSLNSVIDLTFQHWAEYQLKRWYFFTVPPIDSGTAVPDKYIASVSLNLKYFCNLFGQVLAFYFGETITIDLNPGWVYAEEPTTIEISHSYIWDVLIKFYELFAVRWAITPAPGNDNEAQGGERYVIKVGYPSNDISHVFEYGFEGGLLKVERQVQDENIRNMIIGRGGNKNLPYRYFKQHDENNASFSPDPDWIPELATIPFTELHGATFRSYIQGWKTKHYGGASVSSADKAYAPWAWKKGYDDTKFDYVEYVADEIVSNPQEGDRYVQISPTYSPAVKQGSSIDKYGPLQGGLENNEDIYPTIQGISSGDHLNFFGKDFGRVDEVVAVEIPGNQEEGTPSDSTTTNLESLSGWTVRVEAGKYVETRSPSESAIYIPEGKYGNLDLTVYVGSVDGSSNPSTISKNAECTEYSIIVYDIATGEERSAAGIPPGNWGYYVKATVHNMSKDSEKTVGIKIKHTVLTTSTLTESSNGRGWSIWVKNLWGTSKDAGETDKQYAERVWRPILGDREEAEAAVVFSSGWLSINEDYQFKIVGIPEHDESMSLAGAQSHWKIMLEKSDAESEATGELIPNERTRAEAGDHFFFIGIDMPHAYVIWAEERLDDWKKDELEKVRDIKPSWVVGLDKVRMGNEGKPGALIEQLLPGSSVVLEDRRFIPGSRQETLYLTSVTYTYKEPTEKKVAFLPDIEVVLSDKYETVANPVATLQSEVSSISRQISGMSNMMQAFRALGDKTYLRKDRSDSTPYSLSVGGGLTLGSSIRSRNYAEGLTGYGWRTDADGNIYADSLTLRKFLEVPELRYNRTEVTVGNQWQAPGAGIVGAYMHEGTTDAPQGDGTTEICNVGWITLKLEDGEIGSLSVGDFCMGIWHFADGNETEDSDDNSGGFKFAGFRTIYFYVYGVEGERRELLHIRTRSKFRTEPEEGMHFVAYGNDTDTGRQKSAYRTRTYTRYLAGVSGWTWGPENIMMQLGDLSGLTISGMDMSGYSAYLNNVYFSGVIQQIDNAPLKLTYTTLGDIYIGTRGDGAADSCAVLLTAMKGLGDVTAALTSVTCSTPSGTIAEGAVQQVGYSAETGTYNVNVNPTFLNGQMERTLNITAKYAYKGREYTAGVSILFRDISQNKGDKGDKGADAVTYEWQVSPDVIRCNADGTLPGGTATVNVRCYKIEGGSRTELVIPQPPVTLIGTAERIQYRQRWADGITAWADLPYGQNVTLDDEGGRGTFPEIALRVARSDNSLSGSEMYAVSAERTVANVCDGEKGDKGDRGDEGEPGAEGPAGAVLRLSGRWMSAGLYTAGDTPDVYGLRWIDAVYITDSGGNEIWYRCIRSHTASASIRPGTAAGNAYWGPISNLGDILTDMLIANTAFINVLTSREIIFTDSANKVIGRVGSPLADGTVMYTGEAGENVDTSTATFLLGSDGSTRFGPKTGNRITITPGDKEINAYDTGGKNVVKIDGKTTSLDSLYGGTDNLLRTMGVTNYYEDTAISLVRDSANAFSLRIPKGQTATVRVSVDAWLHTEAKYKSPSNPQQLQPIGGAGSSVSAYISVEGQVSEDTVETNRVSSSLSFLQIPGSGDPADYNVHEQTQNEVKTITFTGTFAASADASRDITLKLNVDTTKGTATVDGVTMNTRPYASFRDYSADYKSGASPRSHYGANGLTVANSTQDYIRAGMQEGRFLFEAQAGEQGLRVTEAGVVMRGRTGAYNRRVIGCESSYATDADMCVSGVLGITMYMTANGTMHLPDGASTRFGGITTYSFSAVNQLQEFRTFSSPMQLWTRRKYEGTWSAWTKQI